MSENYFWACQIAFLLIGVLLSIVDRSLRDNVIVKKNHEAFRSVRTYVKISLYTACISWFILYCFIYN